ADERLRRAHERGPDDDRRTRARDDAAADTAAPGGAAPTARLGRTAADVRNNALSVPVVCQVVDCSGTVTLVPKTAHAAAVVTYGSAKFTGKAGKSRAVKVKLNQRGRALLKHHKKVVVSARIA